MDNTEVCIPEKVAAASKAIDQSGTINVGRINMSVNVHLDGRIHSDDKQTRDQFCIVGNPHRTEDYFLAASREQTHEVFHAVLRKGKRCRRSAIEFFIILYIAHHSILKNLSPKTNLLERGFVKLTDNSIGNVTHTRLNGRETFSPTKGLLAI